jgi:hypothetical protein
VRVGAVRDEAHLLHRLHELRGVARERGADEVGHTVAHARRDLGDRAEVDEHDARAAIGGATHEQVSRVRIRVVEAVGEDLLAIRRHHLARELRAIDAELFEARPV